MKNFKETAEQISGIVAELVLRNIDVTSSIQKMAGKPTVIVYEWGVTESYTVKDGVKGAIKISRDIVKSFYVDSDEQIQPCIEHLESLNKSTVATDLNEIYQEETTKYAEA